MSNDSSHDVENDSSALPPCPECGEEYTYEQGALLVCPMCAHEWVQDGESQASENDGAVRDAVGNVLVDGDTVSIVKSLKVSGKGGGTIKIGTKVKGIRLLSEPVNDHDIDATVPGFGKIHLKSSVVKKS